MEINGYSLHNVWREINMKFLGGDPDRNVTDGFFLMKGRDYAIFKSDITLRCHTLILPEDVYPLFRKEKRIKVLTNKYLDKTLWEYGLEGLRNAKRTMGDKTSTGFFPRSYLLQFKLSNPKLETGKGGGCLIGIVLSWVNDRWNLQIFSRITEVTINLLADMYFIQALIRELVNEGDLPGVTFPTINTVWSIALANQKRDRVPLFLLFCYGDEFVRGFMLSKPTNNRWQEVIVNHFWKIFIYPEKINWAQRKRWASKFKELSQIDWTLIKEEVYNES